MYPQTKLLSLQNKMAALATLKRAIDAFFKLNFTSNQISNFNLSVLHGWVDKRDDHLQWSHL